MVTPASGPPDPRSDDGNRADVSDVGEWPGDGECHAVMVAPGHRPWGNRVVREARALVAAGYRVSVICRCDESFVGEGIRFLPGPNTQGRWMRAWNWMVVLRQALRQKGSVYHLHNPAMLPVALGLKLWGRKVIYDTHEDFSRRLMLRRWIPRPLRRPACWWVSRAEYLTSRLVDATLVTQPQQVEAFGGWAVLVRNAPSLDPDVRERVEALTPNVCETRSFYRLLYAGSLTRVRGLQCLLDALGQVNDAGVEVRLWLVGPDDDGVVSDLKRHTAWRFVDYAGLLSHEEVLARMACADVGLAVLPDVGDHSDARPTKLFEYMAWGLPFVASDFPSWRTFVGEVGGRWVTPGQPALLADTLQDMLREPEARQVLSTEGRAFIRHFNWEREQRRLLQVYQDLLAR